MKYVIILLIALSACSYNNTCEYSVSAKYLSQTEHSKYEHVALFKDNTSTTIFIVKFDTRQDLESYHNFNGDLKLDKHNGIFILCAS